MTWTDLYVTVTRLALICTPVVLVCWWHDRRDSLRGRWAARQQRHADHQAIARMRPPRPPVEIISGPNKVYGARITRFDKDGNPVGNPVDLPIASVTWSRPARGTVQNPSDPSPDRIR